MSCIESLLLVARTYAEAEGLPLTTVSWRVFNAAGKVADIIGGADLSTRRFEAAMAWFATNWTDKAAWPDGVRRPEVAPAG